MCQQLRALLYFFAVLCGHTHHGIDGFDDDDDGDGGDNPAEFEALPISRAARARGSPVGTSPSTSPPRARCSSRHVAPFLTLADGERLALAPLLASSKSSARA